MTEAKRTSLPEAKRTASTNQGCRFAVCVALVLATVGDAGPEIVKSGSLFADYDGPGPLIYLAFAVFVALAPWRYAPLAAVPLSAMFIVGGFVDPMFRSRLVTPGEPIEFGAGWLQIVAFAAAIVAGIAAVWWKPVLRDLVSPLAGLGLAILGLIVQWISKPSIFEAPDWGALPGNFPPGVLVLVVFAGLTVLCARWWWSPVFAAAIGVWIFFGGISTGEMANAFTKGNAGSVLGLVLMSAGLVVAIAAGILVMFRRRHSTAGVRS